jgi:hypothetical protein
MMAAWRPAVSSRATSGDGAAAIAAPGAGKQTVLNGIFQLEYKGTGVAVTALVKAGTTVIYQRTMASQADGVLLDFASDPREVGENLPIYVNLSASVDVAWVFDSISVAV